MLAGLRRQEWRDSPLKGPGCRRDQQQTPWRLQESECRTDHVCDRPAADSAPNTVGRRTGNRSYREEVVTSRSGECRRRSFNEADVVKNSPLSQLKMRISSLLSVVKPTRSKRPML